MHFFDVKEFDSAKMNAVYEIRMSEELADKIKKLPPEQKKYLAYQLRAMSAYVCYMANFDPSMFQVND